MSIYYDESGMEKPPTVFTEFAGGILDSYYLRIKQAESELEDLRSRNRRLDYDHASVEEDRDRWETEAESQRKHAERNERVADRLQGQLDKKALEIAKRDKVIEQYAAWRVAVREAINDLPEDNVLETISLIGTPSRQLVQVIRRIVDLTNKIEEEPKSD